MTERNRLRTAWSEGRSTVGGWCAIPSSFSAELVASLGPDYVCIDMQHGLTSFSELVPMLQAIAIYGPTPLVRIPHGDLATAQRALDAGAQGLIIPLVQNARDAAEAAAVCRYPPLGTRSYGPIRSRLHLGTDTQQVNREVLCIAMIETAEGLENLDEIVGCPGVDAVYVGPADLALALGASVGSEDAIEAALDRILSACRRRDVPAGIHSASGDGARKALNRGFMMATVTTDAALLSAVYQQELAAARGAPAAAFPVSGPYGGPAPSLVTPQAAPALVSMERPAPA